MILFKINYSDEDSPGTISGNGPWEFGTVRPSFIENQPPAPIEIAHAPQGVGNGNALQYEVGTDERLVQSKSLQEYTLKNDGRRSFN